jgi:hypothetical protein
MSHLSAAKEQWEEGVLAKTLSRFPERKANFETVLAEYSHPFKKGDPLGRSVVESLPATPTRKAGHELPTFFPRATRQ